MNTKPRIAKHVARSGNLTLSTQATPFGCCNFFDSCTDQIMNLSWGGKLPLLDWMGFNVTDECYKSVEFITYNRPEQSGGSSLPGWISDPCTLPNGYEIGTAKITVEDFGIVGHSGPVRNMSKAHVKYCKNSPMYRLDGTPIISETEWDMNFAMSQIAQTLSRLLITGNATTQGQFDGLQRWVATTYNDMLNSWVVDWNGNPLTGGAGITVNGVAASATADIIEYLLSIFRRIRQRISWNAMLSAQRPRIGDFILVAPTSLTHCLLDFYTCWSVCEGKQYTEANLNTFEARDFRNGLVAERPENIFGHGFIRLDQIVVPLLAYDWELINSSNTFDMYFLTGSYGGFRAWEGHHLSTESIVRNAAEFTGAGAGEYKTTDGGRTLIKKDFDALCSQIYMWMFPRLFCYAPWMQMRFQDVQCNDVVDPLSPDPDSSFYPLSSFTPADCP